MEEQHGKIDPAFLLLFTKLSISYFVEDFENPTSAGRISTAEMVSKSWESLDTIFTTRPSGSVMDITLFFGTILAT